MTNIPTSGAGWYPDPTGVNQLRYFDTQWTDHVSNGGVASTSPLATQASWPVAGQPPAAAANSASYSPAQFATQPTTPRSRKKFGWIVGGGIVVVAAVIAVIVVVNSGSSGSNQTAGSNPAGGGSGLSAAALESTCVADYKAEDFGQISGPDGSSDPAPYCDCVIPGWLATGDSSQKIANAMESDVTDSGGVAPIGFSQISACSDEDPTIDPHTGIPYS